MWRNKLAEAAGYEVARIDHEDEAWNPPMPVIDWGHVTKPQLMGEWEETPDDPLLVLIAHSDCDGKIYPEQAEPLSNRLEELLPALSNVEFRGSNEYLKRITREFIDGLREAFEEGEPVEFG